MNRQKFLNILSKQLKRLPKEERESAIAYYTEYFDEAGVENEASVIQTLPHPSHIAAKILAEFSIKEGESPEKKPHQISVFTMICAVLSAPIAIPLALALVLVALSFLLVFAILALIPFLFVGCMLLVSVVGFPLLIPAFGAGIATGLVFFGMFSTNFGLLGLMSYGLFRLLSMAYTTIKRMFSNLIIRRYRHEA